MSASAAAILAILLGAGIGAACMALAVAAHVP
jgi:hypothetical protein